VHRFRLSRRSLELQRNEIAVSGGPSWLRLSAGYVKLSDELSTDNLGEREELRFDGAARLNQYWSLSAYDRIDLTDNGGTLVYGGALTYEDECISLRLGYQRTFTRDRDVAPATTIGFQIRLQNLG
jgi:LPS-assembly protein